MDNDVVKLAYIDVEGNLLDNKTRKKMGKGEKNGDFMYKISETNDGKKLTVGAPMGMCEVRY
jgi:hypothetical protein